MSGVTRLPISSIRKEEIKHDFLYRCVYCGDKAECIDHILPYSWKANNSDENLVPSCTICNLIAGSMVFDTFQDKIDFITDTRETPKWKRRIEDIKASANPKCTTCHKDFYPYQDGATAFVCKDCEDLPYIEGGYDSEEYEEEFGVLNTDTYKYPM